MTPRRLLNIVTIVLIVVILFFSRHELVKAWDLLGNVNLWILLLLLPIQFLSYYAAGATIFSYLRSRGDLRSVSGVEAAKMSLELNFVNHILPSGGVSGISYMSWRLNKLGVPAGRATLAQVVKFAVTFAAFAALMVVAVLMITFDGAINWFIILVSSGLLSAIIIGTLVTWYAIGSRARLVKVSNAIHRAVNWVWRVLLRRRHRELLPVAVIEKFFDDLHDDYTELKRSPRRLLKPFIWGVVFNVAEMAMFWVAFMAFGSVVNPAPIMIAIGLAGLVGIFLVTPGGAGGYEAAMILFLSSAGMSAGLVVAGVVVARVLLILLTILSGYIFYHHALKKYGGGPRGSADIPG